MSRTKRKPDRVRRAEKTFLKCPKGHALPHHTNAGQCTPIYCADKAAQTKRHNGRKIKEAKKEVLQRIKDDSDPLIRRLLPADDPALPVMMTAAQLSRTEEAGRLGTGAGRFAARLSALGVPMGLKDVAAEQWSDSQLIELLPYAVAEKKYQLLYGDDSMRERASDAILSATGRKQKDGGGNSAPTIIVVGGGPGGALNYPWARRAEPAKLAEPTDAQE